MKIKVDVIQLVFGAIVVAAVAVAALSITGIPGRGGGDASGVSFATTPVAAPHSAPQQPTSRVRSCCQQLNLAGGDVRVFNAQPDCMQYVGECYLFPSSP